MHMMEFDLLNNLGLVHCLGFFFYIYHKKEKCFHSQSTLGYIVLNGHFFYTVNTSGHIQKLAQSCPAMFVQYAFVFISIDGAFTDVHIQMPLARIHSNMLAFGLFLYGNSEIQEMQLYVCALKIKHLQENDLSQWPNTDISETQSSD